MIRKILSISVLIAAILACSSATSQPAPQPQQVITQVVITQVITQVVSDGAQSTPQPTYTFYPTYTAPEPAAPVPTETPAFTATPEISPTPDLFGVHKPGFYLVNVDIGPGQWRSTGKEDGCYAALTDSTGNILNNHFGLSGVTISIDPTIYQVEFGSHCGDWVFLSQ